MANDHLFQQTLDENLESQILLTSTLFEPLGTTSTSVWRIMVNAWDDMDDHIYLVIRDEHTIMSIVDDVGCCHSSRGT